MHIRKRLYRVVSKNFVAGVITTTTLGSDMVIEAAPILKKFIGQPFINLHTWARKNNMEIKEIDSYEK